MEIADRLEQKGTEKASKNIAELKELSGKLHLSAALPSGADIVGSMEA